MSKKISPRISCTVILALIILAILFPHYSKLPVNPYDTWLHTERFFLFGDVEPGYSFDLFRTRAEVAYAFLAGFIIHALLKTIFQRFTTSKTKISGSR